MFNPTIKDFLKEKPQLTVVGLYWAGFWRLYLIILGIAFGFGIMGAITG